MVGSASSRTSCGHDGRSRDTARLGGRAHARRDPPFARLRGARRRFRFASVAAHGHAPPGRLRARRPERPRVLGERHRADDSARGGGPVRPVARRARDRRRAGARALVGEHRGFPRVAGRAAAARLDEKSRGFDGERRRTRERRDRKDRKDRKDREDRENRADLVNTVKVVDLIQSNKSNNGSTCTTGSTCNTSPVILYTGIKAVFMAVMAFQCYNVNHFYDASDTSNNHTILAPNELVGDGGGGTTIQAIFHGAMSFNGAISAVCLVLLTGLIQSFHAIGLR